MDKRVIIAAGILVVVLVAVLIAVKQEKKPPEPKSVETPFAELNVERPKKARDWVHPAMKKVDRIKVTKNGQTVEIKRVKVGDFKRDFGEWEIVSPFKYAADPFAVRQVLQRLTTLRYWEPVSGAGPKEHANLGVTDASGFRVAVFQGTREIADLYLGKEIRTKLADRPLTYTYLRAAKQNTVWKIKGSLKPLTRRTANEWREPKILHVKRDEVFEISLTTPEGSVTVARDPNEKDPKKRGKDWKLTASNPPLDSIEVGDISRMASTLSYLRAKDFADKVKPADVGLDKPTHTITIKTKDAKTKKDETFTLLFGKVITEKVKRGKTQRDEKLVHIKLKSNPQVFIVQESRLQSLMKSPAELRNRTIVTLDKSQEIVGLEVHKGKEKIVLELEGGKWVAKQPKDLKYDAKTIGRDISTLGSRFTAKEFSKVTDPAKTGLDKPQGRLIVTVETKGAAPKKAKGKDAKKAKAKAKAKGKRHKIEILIGKTAAKREYYVQVKGRADVFVMRQYTLDRVWKGKAKWNPPKRRPGARGGMPGRMPGRMPGNFRMPPRRGR